MAAILVDGFDLYNGTGANTGVQAKWSGGDTGGGSLVAGRFTGQAWQVASAAASSRLIPRSFTASASFACGIAIKSSGGLPGTQPKGILYFTNGGYSGTYQVGLTVTPLGAIVVGRYTAIGSSTVLGTSANGVIAGNTWHYVEVEVTISDTVGVFNVYVDGASILALSAIDTRNGTPTTCDAVLIGVADSSGMGTWLFDDLYITDSATKLGERRVETLYPTSDVAQGFARSTGATNYTLVDEAQVNGDTDYVQGSSVGDVDTYGFQDLTGLPAAISAIQFSAFAEKTDATSRSIALQVKSGVTTSDGSNFALAASYGKFERLLTTDPNTSAAWTAANVNAVTGGPKVTV